MPTVHSGYTFTDFLRRLERSPESHMAPLYHEHSILFVRRSDMFSKAIGAVTWEKGAALLSAARYVQPVDVQVYRALLARMLLHNRHVQQTRAGVIVPWVAALRVYYDAVLTHGRSIPTRMTLSALRLCAPHRQWMAAISLLQLSQANGVMTLPSLIDAAHCCATPAAWEMALGLLGRYHTQSGHVLPDAVQSLRPLGTNKITMDATANALLRLDNGPTPEQKHVLRVLKNVVSSVPWEVALSNTMCVSYLTHLTASTTLAAPDKTAALTRAVSQLPWSAFTRLMDAVASETHERVPPADAAVSVAPRPLTASWRDKEVEITPLDMVAVREGLNLLQHEPETAVPFVAAVIDKLPSTEAAALFLNEATAMYRGVVGGASARVALRHPIVINALLKKCAQTNSWAIASSVLRSTAPVPLPCDVSSALLIQMRRAKQPSVVVDVVQRYIVPSGTRLNQEAVDATLLCIFAHNQSVSAFSTAQGSRSQPRCGAGGHHPLVSAVHWLSALSWATDLLEDGAEARILDTGTAPSMGGVSYRQPTVLPRMKPLSPCTLSLLVHICVGAGSPQGALTAIGYARTVDKTELALSEEIRALLYCLIYNRPFEAKAIVKHAVKRHGTAQACHLERLLGTARGGGAYNAQHTV
ncbi:hypothetical protein ERJ75_000321500 [Trypanosoma vivax]|uniref:Uncharacterized protein n=1 Tax=Trypanosoma vivax (strain Y486) TaxID=1055687 RepID=G0UAA2_TRYVY|nr:hypothetical protein TRVL_02903 [Trypanosoma vivax]KAH8617937.1 hypothetical protein ERJ75_000321500 [Trypanosoma vivax]CCC52735.1 conserved hypothetical protein [Trypanosoma vivax Y486]